MISASYYDVTPLVGAHRSSPARIATMRCICTRRDIAECNRLYLGRIISKPQAGYTTAVRRARPDSARVKYAFAPRDNASRTLNSQSR